MAELEKGSIAYELQEIVKAKDEISKALESIASGATTGFKFSEYGGLIEALFAIQYIGINSTEFIIDNQVDLNNLLLKTKRLACYFLHTIDLEANGNEILNYPEGLKVVENNTDKKPNCFIITAYLYPKSEASSGNDVNARAIQILVPVTTVDSHGLYYRVRIGTNWSSKGWKALTTEKYVENEIKNIDISNTASIVTSSSTAPSNSKPGDI